MKLTTLDIDQLLTGVSSRLVYEGSICASWPCWNDGICIPNGTKSFSCQCTPLYIGDRCQIQISNLCEKAGCAPGTSCSTSIWTGLCPNTSIDFISSCISSSCLNGGTCEETIIGHKCRCLPPFHGPFCQYDSMQLGWTIFEIFMLFGFITLILVAMAIICCSYNRNMGVYVSVPTVKNYDRWSGTGEVSDEEEDVIALGDLRKGIRTSQTKETILEAEAGCSNSFNQPML